MLLFTLVVHQKALRPGLSNGVALSDWLQNSYVKNMLPCACIIAYLRSGKVLAC
jgi:hypothetical protein